MNIKCIEMLNQFDEWVNNRIRGYRVNNFVFFYCVLFQKN